MPTDRQAPTRPGSKTDIQGAERELDRVLGGAENQRRQDQPKRTATLPNMAALKAPPIIAGSEPKMPGPPPLPLEHSRTVPAAAHQAATQRAPSPIAVQVVRIADAPYGHPAPSVPPQSQDSKDAQIAALIRQRDQLLVKESAPPTRGAWAKLGYKVATAIVAALVIIIAALALWGKAAIDAKREAIKAAQEAKKKAGDRDEQWKAWAAVAIWIVDCRNDQQIDVNEQLLPAPDKMGSARKPEPWVVKCPRKLPPAP